MSTRRANSTAFSQSKFIRQSSNCSPVAESDETLPKYDETPSNLRSFSTRGRSNCVPENCDEIVSSTQTQQSSYNRYLSRYSEPYSNPDRRQKITINVSGERYQTFVDTLEGFPHTLLGNSHSRDKFYDDVEDEYFFDRDRNAFSAILYYYQSGGQLYCPLTLPLHILVTEAAFFRLGTDALKQVLDIVEEKEEEMPKNELQKRIWCLFEYPETSTAANILTIFSVVIILLSISTLCIETIPALRPSPRKDSDQTQPPKLEKHYLYRYEHSETSPRNVTASVEGFLNKTRARNATGHRDPQMGLNRSLDESSGDSANTEFELKPLWKVRNGARQRRDISSTEKAEAYHHHWPVRQDASGDNETCLCTCSCTPRIHHKGNSASQRILTSSIESNIQGIDWPHIFDMCEVVFVIWFTIEYFARLLSCPKKLPFIKNYLNIIDILSILPYYVMLGLNKQGGIGLNFRIIRLVRVFRIFKLSRHSKGLQILGLTFSASLRELGLLIFFILMGVVLFSSAIYYVETDTENFPSIPEAFWWAIITMCTVGYGDKVPQTFWGKVIGSCCAVSGVLCIALPVPVIVSNFDYFYNRERTSKMHKHVLSQAENTCSKTSEDQNCRSPVQDRRDHTYQNGSTKQAFAPPRSPNTSRNDEIQKQSLIRTLEKRNRKLSQRLSQTSMMSPMRKNGGMVGISTIQECESFM